MSQKSYPFPELRQLSRFFGPKNLDATKEVDQLRLSVQIILVDSTAAIENVPLPIAGSSQGKIVIIEKISADAHNVNAIPNPRSSDKVNGGASKLVGAAQYSQKIFVTDGISNWYCAA